MWTRSLSFILWWLLVFTTICTTTSNIAPACPDECLCSTTEEGLHKAVCTSLSSLHKYATRNKLHNINIINLHGAGVVKVNDELDKFNEVVSLDLSDNKIEHVNKIMKNSKKLTHIDLSNNKLKEFSANVLPQSVSSIDLSNNRLKTIPSSLQSLIHLEHLLLKGNPLECSCHNIKILHHINQYGVVLDDIKCINKPHFRLHDWKELKLENLCSDKKQDVAKKHIDLDDMMMGDQPSADTEMIAEEMSDKKSMPLIDSKDLDNAEVFESSAAASDNDEEVFLGVSKKQNDDLLMGSGDYEIVSDSSTDKFGALVNTEVTPIVDIREGSGDVVESSTSLDSYLYDETYDGSGDDEQNGTTTTEPFITRLYPFFSNGHVTPSTNEPFEPPQTDNIFLGGRVDWDKEDPEPTTTTQKAIIEETVIKSAIDATATAVKISKDERDDEDEAPMAKSSVGTYVCVGILICILVILIAVVIMKNIIRKRRDRRYIRQQKKDVEKAGKEMVEMNKSLLGKPVNVGDEPIKKQNGNYELVPTHEPTKKNGTIDSRKSADETPLTKINVPKEMSENSPNNNVPSYPTNGQSHSHDLPDQVPHINGHNNSPQLNGGHYPDNLLGPPNEYIPVYDADAGRVRIKMTETPKPKTPVLITRSRSNAGDIIITPVSEPSSPAKYSS